MKAILFSIISSNKFYEFITLFLASLASEQLYSISKGKRWYWRALIYLLGYLGCLLAALLIYAVIQHFRVHSQVFLAMCSFGRYTLKKNFISFIAVPLTVRIADWISGIFLKKSTQIIFVTLCMLGILGTAFLPTNHSAEETVELGDRLFYAAKFYDVGSFMRRANDGWLSSQAPEIPDGVRSDSAADDADELPTEPIAEMDFAAAVSSAIIFYNHKYYDEEAQCIDRAYTLYLEGYASDNWYIALMWWYKGDLENSLECYLNAARAFGEFDDYYNAAVSYRAAYNMVEIPEYAERTLAQYLSYLTSDADVSQAELDRIISFLYRVYNDAGGSVPYLMDFGGLYPDGELCGVRSSLR